MRIITTALGLSLAILPGAPALAASDDAKARTTDRAPQQVAALVRGVAAGNGWAVAEEMTLAGGGVIALHLCQESGEDDRAPLCGQFAVLGDGTGSEIVLLHVGTALTPPADAADRMRAFSEVLDAASAPSATGAEGRFRCDASGCP